MKNLIRGVLLLACFSISTSAYAEKVSCAVVLVNDAFKENSRAIQMLSAQAIRDEGLLVQDPEELKETDPERETIVAVASAAGLDVVYSLEALPLGKRFIVTFAAHDPKTYDIVDSRQLNMVGLSEAEIVVKRAFRSLIQGTTLAESADAKTILRSESRRQTKKKAEYLFGIGLSGGMAATEKQEGYYGAFFQFAYGAYPYRLDVLLGGGGGPNGSLSNIALGGAYVFGDDEVAPYLGLDLGWGSIETRESEELDNVEYESDGIFFGVKGGFEFLRFYDVRLVTDLRILIPAFASKLNTLGEEKKDKNGDIVGFREVLTSESRYHPIGLVTFSIFWRD